MTDMHISRILVPADWVHEGQPRNDRAEFKLGLGSCGLVVRRLTLTVDKGCIQIVQKHDGAPPKVFLYPLAQLHGRVEIEYA